MDCYNVWVDIVIPLVSALIGGGITLWGVILTIRHETKKAKEEYKERIKPFVVIENNAYEKRDFQYKKVIIKDDYLKNVENNNVYTLYETLFSNVGESICSVSFIRINDIKYKPENNIVIKEGELFSIIGRPFSKFVMKSLDKLSICFMDKDNNLYEYKVEFKIIDHSPYEEKHKKEFINRFIECLYIDCRNNLYREEGETKQ